jgi:hypothetical protein
MIRFKLIVAIFVLIVQMLNAQHTNITITTISNPNEPSIYIDPKNPSRMMAANNISDYYTSDDGGFTWKWGRLQSELGVWGDPCIVADTAGNFYFFHLSNPPAGEWIDRIVCQRTDDFGTSWTPGSGIGHVPGKAQDKEWVVVNPYNNEIYITWTQFDNYGSENPADSSIIRFSKSSDMGETWSEPVRLCKIAGDCIDSDNTVEGAVPTVGPEGQIYVSWAGPAGIVFDKSLDGGTTWLEDDIFITEQIGGWDQTIPGIFRCNGMPVTDCDRSNSPYRGTIYVTYADQRNGVDDTDIWLTKSTDEGNTWSTPIRVNDDVPGRHQFFPWMTVDQTTGKLWFVFCDRRNHSDLATDVYMAVSDDGGETFTNFKVSKEPFIPDPTIFFGDYNNISATNNIIRPVWTRLHNCRLSILTAIIDPEVVGINSNEFIPYSETQITPNPFKHSTAFSFKLRRPAEVSLSVNDITGRPIIQLIDRSILGPGKYTKILEAEGYNLQPGAYIFMLRVDNKLTTRKVIYTP